MKDDTEAVYEKGDPAKDTCPRCGRPIVGSKYLGNDKTWICSKCYYDE